MRITGPALLSIILLASAAAAAGPERSEHAPRLDDAQMQALVRDQISLVRKGRLKDAQRSLERKLGAVKSPLARADLLEAFGVELYGAIASLSQRDAIEASLDYLTRAADGYRMLLGNDHPEVATALVRKAEMERLLRPDNPDPGTDIAYETAYRIRVAKLGATAPTTLSTLIPMAELQALPSRSGGDPGKIESATALLHQVIDGTNGAADPAALALRADAFRVLEAIERGGEAAAPFGRRLQALPPAARECSSGSPDDVMVFSGEAAALGIVRQRFAKARLTLRPCGTLLLFPLAPGADPTPVLDLLGDISAGRMKGVRMNLIEARKRPSP